MFDVFKNRLEITGTLTTVTALHIGVGRSTEPIGSDLPVLKDALGRPLIPGSSLKGRCAPAWRVFCAASIRRWPGIPAS